MGQAERRASSTRRGPSTPTAPDSVGSPPRKAMRNSLSHRLSREEMGAEELARGALEGVDMHACEVSRDWAQREWIVVSGRRMDRSNGYHAFARQFIAARNPKSARLACVSGSRRCPPR